MLAVAAASTVMAYQAQRSAAADQNAFMQENAEAAVDNARRNYADIQARQLQEQSAASHELEDINRNARQEASAARVAAGEAGVSGLSVDALLGDIYGNAARKRDAVATNRDWTVEQLQREQLGIQAQSKDRINSVRGARGPHPMQLGLGIASGGLNAYSAYSRMSPDEPSRSGAGRGYSRTGDGRTDSQ